MSSSKYQTPMHKEKLLELNNSYASVIRDISVLGTLNWPDESKDEFLRSLEAKNPKIPVFTYPKKKYTDKKAKLVSVLKSIGSDNSPEINFLRSNTESYIQAIDMIAGVGTSAVTEISKELYGSPYDKIPGHNVNSLEAAKFFLKVESKFKSELAEVEGEDIPAEKLKEYLEANISKVFKEGEVIVEIDSRLASRASVSSRKVKIRANTIFKKHEARQLLHHEVFTHALCSINGINQPYMKSMEFTSPRITATQEGLAQFSELMTGAIHLLRLKRVALRVIALEMAMNGADFLDLFKFFANNVDNNEEAYMSAMRILRGGVPKGGIIFFKDGVYIKGMLEVFSFFMKSLEENNLDNLFALFAGKMTTSDVADMNGLIKAGLVEKAKYVPIWFDNIHNLAAILAFMQFANRLDFEV